VVVLRAWWFARPDVTWTHPAEDVASGRDFIRILQPEREREGWPAAQLMIQFLGADGNLVPNELEPDDVYREATSYEEIAGQPDVEINFMDSNGTYWRTGTCVDAGGMTVNRAALIIAGEMAKELSDETGNVIRDLQEELLARSSEYIRGIAITGPRFGGRLLSGRKPTNPAALNEVDSRQPMDDQTGIDVHERGKYSEDRREHHEGDGDTPEEMPIERHVTDPNPRGPD
jgi:hypothetical protein